MHRPIRLKRVTLSGQPISVSYLSGQNLKIWEPPLGIQQVKENYPHHFQSCSTLKNLPEPVIQELSMAAQALFSDLGQAIQWLIAASSGKLIRHNIQFAIPSMSNGNYLLQFKVQSALNNRLEVMEYEARRFNKSIESLSSDHVILQTFEPIAGPEKNDSVQYMMLVPKERYQSAMMHENRAHQEMEEADADDDMQPMQLGILDSWFQEGKRQSCEGFSLPSPKNWDKVMKDIHKVLDVNDLAAEEQFQYEVMTLGALSFACHELQKRGEPVVKLEVEEVRSGETVYIGGQQSVLVTLRYQSAGLPLFMQ